jgi:hypothetical protein
MHSEKEAGAGGLSEDIEEWEIILSAFRQVSSRREFENPESGRLLKEIGT